MKEFRVKEVCQSCKGTGLYSGMGESKDTAVVCRTCKGTGCNEYVHTYEDFTQRKDAQGIKRVYETNPGIKIGEGTLEDGTEIKLSDFGGMPFKEWEAGLPFKRGMEMRKFTCPSWWFQSANYKLKPGWDECYSSLGGYISNCKCFKDKDKCWERFDKENPE